jgi:hypothetical protein
MRPKGSGGVIFALKVCVSGVKTLDLVFKTASKPPFPGVLALE